MSLSQFHSFYILTNYFLKIHFNIILQLFSQIFQTFFSQGIPTKTSAYILVSLSSGLTKTNVRDKQPPMDMILISFNPIQMLETCLSRLQFNNILPFPSQSSKLFPSFRFFYRYVVWISYYPIHFTSPTPLIPLNFEILKNER
jgi:hypothetical protein